MNREEMQARCKKNTTITEDDVWAVSPIYCILDFSKDDFCKLIDAIGLEKWTEKKEHWNRLARADEELRAKDRYRTAKDRMLELEDEMDKTRRIIEAYEEGER